MLESRPRQIRLLSVEWLMQQQPGTVLGRRQELERDFPDAFVPV